MMNFKFKEENTFGNRSCLFSVRFYLFLARKFYYFWRYLLLAISCFFTTPPSGKQRPVPEQKDINVGTLHHRISPNDEFNSHAPEQNHDRSCQCRTTNQLCYIKLGQTGRTGSSSPPMTYKIWSPLRDSIDSEHVGCFCSHLLDLKWRIRLIQVKYAQCFYREILPADLQLDLLSRDPQCRVETNTSSTIDHLDTETCSRSCCRNRDHILVLHAFVMLGKASWYMYGSPCLLVMVVVKVVLIVTQVTVK